MTPDHAVALSFVSLSDLPRTDLAARLRADDPVLMELAHAWSSRARVVREEAARQNIHVIAWNQPEFPAALLTLGDCPPALWYQGHLEVLDSLAIAIVGSRAASAVALETASRIASDLAARDITVVSGLARGVDSAAHRGAMQTGCTAAVLGSGLDRVYPAEHVALAHEIAAHGIVLSEYPPGTPPLPHHFPQRNRLISGLSRAVVVIEANEKSGSLITAACALDQGRDVMAVPGNVLSGRNRGAHALIRDGAKIVEGADDIVGEIWPNLDRPDTTESDVSNVKSVSSVDPIVRQMEAGQVYDIDALVDLSGLGSARLMSRLMELELQGQIRRVGGGRFMRS